MRASQKVLLSILLAAFSCAACAGLLGIAAWGWFNFRPQPPDSSRELYPGVAYSRESRSSPRPLVIHVVTVDLRQPGVGFLVTPGEPQEELPLRARTASQFLDEFNLQIAINGDGCLPWRSNGPLDYYPHAGDPVRPVGFAASLGTVYAADTDDEPTLYISRTNRARFNTPIGKVYNAISGNLMLVQQGKSLLAGAAAGSSLEDAPQPRTAVALDKPGRRLILVVVDGRQPNYSEGVTLAELADILLDHGGYFGMNLDGGGSSTLVIEGDSGVPEVLNSPIDQGLPGRERPVGNHLGIYAGD